MEPPSTAILPWLSFHRCIRLRAVAGGDCAMHVRVALEDDFHHFRLQLQTQDGRIATIGATSPRHPYSLCPTAAAELQQLVGLVAPTQAHSLTNAVNAREQCTHLLDLAGLACAAARRGPSTRRYDIEVPLRANGATVAHLARDGLPLLTWQVQDMTISGPAPYIGVELRHGMARWALARLPSEEAEAALVLRRAAVISMGKGKPLDAQLHARPTGSCFAQRPDRAPLALREVGSTWDFTNCAAALCQDDRAWLTSDL